MGKYISEIRIYVACLASYNGGILHGEWIDACQSENEIFNDVKTMLDASSEEYAEEWAIHDYEGFEGASISAYESFNRVAEIAAFIQKHGALGGKVLEYYNDMSDTKNALENQYAGEYTSTAEFAEEITSQTTEIPDSLEYYINYSAMARDLEINDILAIETGFEEIHIFWSH